MMTTNNRFVTVFVETGFLGRRAVHLIRKNGFSVRTASSRHPDRAQMLFALDEPQLQSWNLLSEISGKKVECWDETKRRQSA